MQLLDISIAQQKVLDYYRAYIKENGQSPTLADATAALDVNHGTIAFHLKKLEDAGYIRRRPGMRNVVLTEKAQ